MAISFVLVQAAVFGFLLAGAFSPNHIGMPTAPARRRYRLPATPGPHVAQRPGRTACALPQGGPRVPDRASPLPSGAASESSRPAETGASASTRPRAARPAPVGVWRRACSRTATRTADSSAFSTRSPEVRMGRRAGDRRAVPVRDDPAPGRLNPGRRVVRAALARIVTATSMTPVARTTNARRGRQPFGRWLRVRGVRR